ncbi:MAG: DNA polymerase III subunit beta [Acholeplasmatales bacterium]|jgi:DNA polymerase-3 subunit beta|nr:DNA polymerase III subunit beta [Acholeplasmatales bacterium]
MHFIINKEVLLNSLLIASKALPSNTNVVVNRSLVCIKIQAKNNTLTLIANSSEIAILTVVKDDSLLIKEENTIVAPGKSLIEMIRKIDDILVELLLLENQLLIKSHNLEYKLNLFNVEDYPEVEFLEVGNKIIFNASVIKNSSKEVGFSAATIDKRPLYQGINFKYNNGILVNSATDGFRLSTKNTPLNLAVASLDFTIPSKSIDELARLLDYYNEDIEVFVDRNSVLFKFQNTMFRTRLLEGVFPDIAKIIPTNFNFELYFLREDILRAIDRVSITSTKDNGSRLNQVDFKVRLDKVVELSAINEAGSSKQEVIPSREIVAKQIEMLLNLKYLSDALRSLAGQEIVVCFVDVRRPIVIKDVNNDDLLHIIIPLTN